MRAPKMECLVLASDQFILSVSHPSFDLYFFASGYDVIFQLLPADEKRNIGGSHPCHVWWAGYGGLVICDFPGLMLPQILGPQRPAPKKPPQVGVPLL